MPKPPLFYRKTGTLEPEFVSRDVARTVLLENGYKRQAQFWADAKSCTHLEFYTLREAWADLCKSMDKRQSGVTLYLEREKIYALLGLEETANRAFEAFAKAGG
jgi:hypothetical protein